MKMNDDKLTRISDLLEQIQETEEVIRVHKEHDGLSIQIAQYDKIRENLVNELSELMQDFHFKIKYQKEAA
jgi:hemoglobin-like flavoprotein